MMTQRSHGVGAISHEASVQRLLKGFRGHLKPYNNTLASRVIHALYNTIAKSIGLYIYLYITRVSVYPRTTAINTEQARFNLLSSAAYSNKHKEFSHQ